MTFGVQAWKGGLVEQIAASPHRSPRGKWGSPQVLRALISLVAGWVKLDGVLVLVCKGG